MPKKNDYFMNKNPIEDAKEQKPRVFKEGNFS